MRGRCGEERDHRARVGTVLARLAASLDAVDAGTAATLGVSISDAQASIHALLRQGAAV